jgi:DNA-directed RNA polymerase subunit omega
MQSLCRSEARDQTPAILRRSGCAARLSTGEKRIDNRPALPKVPGSFGLFTMFGSRLSPASLPPVSPAIVPFPAGPARAAQSLRIMTTQLLQEAAQVIPNQQVLINVVSKRVRQLGLGHRPMVDPGPRASLTDIALKEIIAGKLAFEEQTADGESAE